MKTPILLLPLLFVALLGLLLWHPWRVDEPPTPQATAAPPPAEPLYRDGPASTDGTGRYYLDREIARADPAPGGFASRDGSADEVLAPLDLPGDSRVAVIAGDAFDLRLAELLADGRVIALRLPPGEITSLATEAGNRGLDHLQPQLASPDHAGLVAESIDAALLVDAYLSLSQPRELLESLVEALRPGGRLLLVAARPDQAGPATPRELAESQARRELEAIGLQWHETLDHLPGRHLLVFRKP